MAMAMVTIAAITWGSVCLKNLNSMGVLAI
jgi:hypothetical protein